jgi:ligand-binding sensor protein/two-component sensor histidine kinase
MSETGFSIRCPHCFEWSEWPDAHPQDFVIGIEEPKEILRHIKNDPEHFLHKKILSCKNPTCPAPTQCFICPDPESAHHLKEISSWTLPRAFGLRTMNRQDKWLKYSGIIFCIQPVRRQKNIFLEDLLDRELLSRATLGMSTEMKSVFTVFAANIFESIDEEAIWIPVESYTENIRNVPPRYNLFCKICRSVVMRSILKKFKDEISAKPCTICYDTAMMHSNIKAPCQKSDWNHCPRFLLIRQKECKCYKSDYNAIQDLRKDWYSGKITDSDYKFHTCWAGFMEISAPIVVHNHLVGVAMTGQFITNPDNINIDELIQKNPVMDPYRKRLECVKDIFIGNLAPKYDIERYTKKLCVTSESVSTKARLLAQNAKRISDVASVRYRYLRFRLETVFKEEMINYINSARSQPDMFNRSLSNVLYRMREFWAFQAVYFLNCSAKTGDIYLLAHCLNNKPSEYLSAPRMISHTESVIFPTHPISWAWNTDNQEEFQEDWPKALVGVFQKVEPKIEIQSLSDKQYFVVLIPFLDHIYMFLFAERDENAVSSLKPFQKGTISGLCQQVILETCTEIMERLLELRYQETILKTKIDTWRSFSARIAHKINNWLFAARGSLREQRRNNPDYEGVEDVNRAVNKICQITNELMWFSTEQPLNLNIVNIADFINQEIAIYKQVEQSRTIDVNIPDILPECTWDIGKISQILAELLENAIYYTPLEGHIIVSVQHININSSNMIKIIVENDGPGIQQENKLKIFDSFFSTRSGGTGLGLAIVEKIVKAHYGSIYEEGQPGKNAKFIVELPVNVKKEL